MRIDLNAETPGKDSNNHKLAEPLVAVVILNWNTWRHSIECLESLYQMSYDAFRVVLVDNGSIDDSIHQIEEYCEGKITTDSRLIRYWEHNKPIRRAVLTKSESEDYSNLLLEERVKGQRLIIIRNDGNYGFSEGCNIGIRFALRFIKPAFIVLLNNDTVVDADFLANLARPATKKHEIGVVGPKILYYEYGGRSDVIWSAGGGLNMIDENLLYHIGQWEVDRGQYDLSLEVEWVSGAAMLIRCDLFNTGLLLNPAYRFGLEDVEFSIRARSLGWSIVYEPKALVWHKVSQSVSLKPQRQRDLATHFYFVKGNFPKLVYAFHLSLFVFKTLPRWLVRYLAEGRSRATLDEFILNIRRLAEWILGGNR